MFEEDNEMNVYRYDMLKKTCQILGYIHNLVHDYGFQNSEEKSQTIWLVKKCQ